ILLFCFSLILRPPTSTLFPYTTLFRSIFLNTHARFVAGAEIAKCERHVVVGSLAIPLERFVKVFGHARSILKARAEVVLPHGTADRKSTRLNSSHVAISYAVFCLKKKK